MFCFFFQAEDGIRDHCVTGVRTCALPIWPMASQEQFETVRDLVDDAIAGGAQLRCGGPVTVPGFDTAAFYAPTVLTGVTHDMRIMREEVFGPVLPIVTVDSEDEAVALANDSPVRLGASRGTRDRL